MQDRQEPGERHGDLACVRSRGKASTTARAREVPILGHRKVQREGQCKGEGQGDGECQYEGMGECQDQGQSKGEGLG